MERRGVEPPTSALRTHGLTVLTDDQPEVATTNDSGCTNGCTSEPKKRLKSGSDATSLPRGKHDEVKPETVEQDFSAALKMLATLPLSDEDRAEAVRRLLARRNVHAENSDT